MKTKERTKLCNQGLYTELQSDYRNASAELCLWHVLYIVQHNIAYFVFNKNNFYDNNLKRQRISLAKKKLETLSHPTKRQLFKPANTKRGKSQLYIQYYPSYFELDKVLLKKKAQKLSVA